LTQVKKEAEPLAELLQNNFGWLLLSIFGRVSAVAIAVRSTRPAACILIRIGRSAETFTSKTSPTGEVIVTEREPAVDNSRECGPRR
jgi:hypothetical protein